MRGITVCEGERPHGETQQPTPTSVSNGVMRPESSVPFGELSALPLPEALLLLPNSDLGERTLKKEHSRPCSSTVDGVDWFDAAARSPPKPAKPLSCAQHWPPFGGVCGGSSAAPITFMVRPSIHSE